MSITDPIADMLTSVRNAIQAGHAEVDVPYSKIKEGIAEVMVKEGFVRMHKKLEEGVHSKLRLYVKYGPEGQQIVHEIKRSSRPGRRSYLGYAAIPRVREGMGVCIVSTSKGIMSDRACREQKLGGEVLCTIW
jgi:small subunit ribosomal protein S8